MRRKIKPLLENVEILDAGSQGKAVARVDNKVVFVPYAVPGDVVDIQVTKMRKSYNEGRLVRIHKYSSKRVPPKCSHFGLCGGCKWQNMDYQHQLYFKQKQVVDNLERIGHASLPDIEPIIPSKHVFYYRNKLEYTFGNRRWFTEEAMKLPEEERINEGLGFHLPGMWDRVLDIDQCYLQEEPSNKIRLALRDFALKEGLSFFNIRAWKGLLRNLVIRTTSTGDLMVIVVFGDDNKEETEKVLSFLHQNFPEITSLIHILNTKQNDVYSDLPFQVYHGKDHIMEEMDGLRFKIGPLSFFQTNLEQGKLLYRKALEFAELQGNECVYDLYTGTGTIANFVAPYASKVVGIEYVDAAIEDAKVNSKINNIDNTHFFAGDMIKVLTPDFIREQGRPDVLITDPPRAGMHEKVIRRILDVSPDRIVYVSCNPATQARDISLMLDRYEIQRIQPVDMFPHTHHVENVLLLKRKAF